MIGAVGVMAAGVTWIIRKADPKPGDDEDAG